ncbi:MAG: VTT domain-containing protein [Desulfovibrionaceae bacterium]|nr:VTT domain-containing protein [Desulfovibrionaceae bacterium]
MEIFGRLPGLVYLALHVDKYLFPLVETYGGWVYLLLFMIIFCETGLVVTPFLPGDSLLFAVGALAGAGALSHPLVMLIVFIPAVLGDQVNYSIGRYLGRRVFEKEYRLLKREHLLAAQKFYETHGGKAIILARFVPVIRTFAPFVAGVGKMDRGRFVIFNFTGAAIWVLILVNAGFFMGNRPWVRENFSLVIYAIILISVLPMVIEGGRAWLRKRASR